MHVLTVEHWVITIQSRNMYSSSCKLIYHLSSHDSLYFLVFKQFHKTI